MAITAVNPPLSATYGERDDVNNCVIGDAVPCYVLAWITEVLPESHGCNQITEVKALIQCPGFAPFVCARTRLLCDMPGVP